MPARSLSRSLMLRLVMASMGAAAAGSCGGGGDVTEPPGPDPVASVELAPGTLSLALGQTAQLTATPRAADGSALAGRPVAWATTDPTIATVDDGLVTAIAVGEVQVTATSEGKTGTTAVTVSEIGVATVAVVPSPASVAVGQTAQLIAVMKAGDGTELPGRPVSWSSGDPDIATVSATGLVTGIAAGQVTITATIEGQTGSTEVTVSEVAVATVAVTPAAPSVVEGTKLQLTATAKDANGGTLAGRVATWTTSDADVATVSTSGLVTGIEAGSATITATIEGKQGTATVTVTAATGMVRTWQGGAPGKATDWSTGANWSPAGAPVALDTARIAAVANPAVLSADVQVARLLVAGGRARTAGHRLVVKAQD